MIQFDTIGEDKRQTRTVTKESRRIKRESDRARGQTTVNTGLAFRHWQELCESVSYKPDANVSIGLMNNMLGLFRNSF